MNPGESQADLYADAKRRATRQCGQFGKVPEWIAETDLSNPRAVELTFFCLPPSGHTTPEEKDARIAKLRPLVVQGRLTQEQFSQAQAVVLAEP
jgi:hypothetical protein